LPDDAPESFHNLTLLPRGGGTELLPAWCHEKERT